MRDWIIVVVLYVLGMGFFRLLGGFASASDALKDWARTSSASRRGPASTSS